MKKPLDELYLEWLYDQIVHSRQSYWRLFKQLYEMQFVWIVANDDNRAEDGIDLRLEFAERYSYELDEDWLWLPCSVLEVLIVLARLLSFEGEGAVSAWFWKLLNNLGMYELTDEDYRRDTGLEERIDESFHQVLWRTYDEDGLGGLFPLKRATTDQRRVELWYQLNAYLLEQL